MADLKHIIEPERQGLWIAATFIIALLALVLAIIGIQRADELTDITQTEVVLLNKKIAGGGKVESAPAPAAAGQQQK